MISSVSQPPQLSPVIQSDPQPKSQNGTSQGLSASLAGTSGSQASLVSHTPIAEIVKGDTLCEGCGPRQVTITQSQNGSVSVSLNRPPLTSLVLSGGGGKGVAYPGAVQSLEAHGKLEGIRTISGSSAGAITAALLASGMNAGEFTSLSNNMNLISLLDSDSRHNIQKFMEQTASKLNDKLFKKGSIQHLLGNILPRLKSEAAPLELLLKLEASRSVCTQIEAHPELSTLPEIKAISESLYSGKGVTFGDLATLSKYIPAIKELNITGTAMFDGRPQMVLFNASLTPDVEISRAAHISGSFPGVFARPGMTNQPFLEKEEKISLQDGGVMLNVPVPELIHPKFSNTPISEFDNLILKFEEEEGEKADRGNWKSAVQDWVVGAPSVARAALQTRGLEAFTDQTVTVPLKTKLGDFSGMLTGTLNFTMSDEVKMHLQERLAETVGEHLQNREGARQSYQFPSLETALLALSDNDFASVAQENTQQAESTVHFRQAAGEQISVVVASILSQPPSAGVELSGSLANALTQLDKLADSPARQDWIATQFNADNPVLARLLDTEVSEGRFMVLDHSKAEAVRREVATVAHNFINEVIYPSLFRANQPDSNVALMKKTEHALVNATTRAGVNEALQELADNYGARNKPWTKAFNSTTITQAKAWMMKE